MSSATAIYVGINQKIVYINYNFLFYKQVLQLKKFENLGKQLKLRRIKLNFLKNSKNLLNTFFDVDVLTMY